MSKNEAPTTDVDTRDAGSTVADTLGGTEIELSAENVHNTGDVRKAITEIQNGDVGIFASLPAESFDDKKRVLSLLTNSVSLVEADLLNKPFKLAHFILQPVIMTDDKTKELSEVARVILITDDGKSYHAMSGGLLKSLTNLTGLLGHPTEWDNAVDVEVVEKRSRNGYRFMTLNVL